MNMNMSILIEFKYIFTFGLWYFHFPGLSFVTTFSGGTCIGRIALGNLA